MIVHIITEGKSEDYHGTYETVIEVHADETNAKKRVDALIEENDNYDIDYWYTTYDVIEKISKET